MPNDCMQFESQRAHRELTHSAVPHVIIFQLVLVLWHLISVLRLTHRFHQHHFTVSADGLLIKLETVVHLAAGGDSTRAGE